MLRRYQKLPLQPKNGGTHCGGNEKGEGIKANLKSEHKDKKPKTVQKHKKEASWLALMY